MSRELSAIVAGNVKRLRSGNGWTQQDLADRAGRIRGEPVAVTVIRAWEHARSDRLYGFTVDDLYELCKIFDVEIPELILPMGDPQTTRTIAGRMFGIFDMDHEDQLRIRDRSELRRRLAYHHTVVDATMRLWVQYADSTGRLRVSVDGVTTFEQPTPEDFERQRRFFAAERLHIDGLIEEMFERGPRVEISDEIYAKWRTQADQDRLEAIRAADVESGRAITAEEWMDRVCEKCGRIHDEKGTH